MPGSPLLFPEIPSPNPVRPEVSAPMLRPHPASPPPLVAPALLALLVLATPCRASITLSGIEIDGDYSDGPAPEEDWHPGHPPSSDPVGSLDESLCGTSPAPKNDIGQYFLTNDYDYLYVGMERLTNNGNTSFFFRFDITGDGPSVGDFIFVFCYGSGAVVTDTYVLEWDPALSDWAQDASPPEVVFAVNLTRIPAPFGTLDEHGRPDTAIDAGRFAEARIRLSDIEGFDVCLADAVTGLIESKSSCSLSSECKDTTGPFTFSFEPLKVALDLRQAPGCEPLLIAVANAVSPRPATLAYRWFLDGEDITDRDPSWATSDAISIPLDTQCGATTVRVEVSDGTCTKTDEARTDVNRRPVAAIAALSVGACDKTLTFDGTASTDCNGAALQYLWDFDTNGVIDATTASGTFAYAGCGDRLVTLVVSDGDCASEPVYAQVHVNEPPLATLQVIPGACLSVDYAATSADCNLVSPSATHPESLTETLDFGDGTPSAPPGSGSHEYADCGTYVLTLTVSDASGCVSVATRTVTFSGLLDVR